MDKKLQDLIHFLCTGITQPNSDISNIFDLRRAVCLAHYIYQNNLTLDESIFIENLKLNKNFNLNEEALEKLAYDLINVIYYIKDIYRSTADLENLHI